MPYQRRYVRRRPRKEEVHTQVHSAPGTWYDYVWPVTKYALGSLASAGVSYAAGQTAKAFLDPFIKAAAGESFDQSQPRIHEYTPSREDWLRARHSPEWNAARQHYLEHSGLDRYRRHWPGRDDRDA